MTTEPQVYMTVLDYLWIVWRARWMILGLTVVAAGVAYGVTQAQPKIYTARATILPPREAAPSLSLGALLLGSGRGDRDGGASLPGTLGGPAITTSQDIFIALLKSRTVREAVVAELTKSWGPSVGGMLGSGQPDTKEKGIIALTVEARDPKLAAEAANAYFVQLDTTLERYSEQSTRRQESAYAAQLERAAKEVDAAEAALLQFQSENRVIAVDSGTKSGVEQVASLRGFIMSLEMQREIMRMRFTDQHPQMRELEKQIGEMKRQYSKNLFGEAMELPPESPAAKGVRKEFFVATAKLTPVQFGFLKLYRNLKIQEAYYTMALQGLQQMKYGADSNTRRVEVLDPALVPSAPSRPAVLYTVIVATVTAFVAGVLLALVDEYVRRLRTSGGRAQRAGTARAELAPDRKGGVRAANGERLRHQEAGEMPAMRS